jgi:AcrR family transcriptional regulator
MSVQSSTTIIIMPRTKEQFEFLRQESRKKILDAAMEVFARDGYKTATIGSIAKTAGISQGLLYNYFRSKEEVLRELLIGILEEMMSEFEMISPDKKLIRKDMIEFINKSIDLVLEKPQLWKLYFSIFLQPEVLALLYTELMKLSVPYMNIFTNYFKEKGESNPALMARYFSAALDGIQMHCMLEPDNYPANDMKKLLIKQFA